MSLRIKFANDVSFHLIDTEALVFVEETQKLYGLNTSAAFIWCQIEEHDGELSKLPDALRETYNISLSDAQTMVARALADWQQWGFIDGVERREGWSPGPDMTERYPPPDLPPVPDIEWAATRYYRLLGQSMRLRMASQEHDARIAPMLQHLEIAANTAGDAIEIVVVDLPDGIGIYRDHKAFISCKDLAALAPATGACVFYTALEATPYLFGIHCGVVSNGKGCVMLPGAPGNGKSTLTAALVHAGFTYFTDETALFPEHGFAVRPVPYPPCVKSTGFDILRPLFPVLDELTTHHRPDGKIVRYLPVNIDVQAPDYDQPQPVKWLIFPRYQSGSATKLEPLTKVAALQQLMDECISVSKRLDASHIDAMAQWITDVECYALPNGSLHQATTAVSALLNAEPAPINNRE